jgi:hypothetical protein
MLPLVGSFFFFFFGVGPLFGQWLLWETKTGEPLVANPEEAVRDPCLETRPWFTDASVSDVCN